ncbi:AHH domain-containing protein [Massilia sp. W12]|uniref:AHH domain-containing protein n=1 Tax=Massilia sp. W12 TaxID=3126507 RepID=UPI0030CFF853
MPKDQTTTEEIYAKALPNQQELTLAANRLCKTDNPYEVRNQLILQEKKRQILYKNGVTLPAKAEQLQQEAARKLRHARKLAANMHRADPNLQRHPDADAHHIVAAQDVRAELSRLIMFNEGVGINDFANGCYTKRKKTSKVPHLPNSLPHENIHTDVYHFAVYQRLLEIVGTGADECRAALQKIAAKIVAGIFPY